MAQLIKLPVYFLQTPRVDLQKFRSHDIFKPILAFSSGLGYFENSQKGFYLKISWIETKPLLATLEIT